MNTNFPSKSISVVTKVITSPVDKKTMEDEIPVFLCNYTDVYYNPVINENMTFMEATAKQSEVDRFSLHPNDVVITKDSESADDIGIPTYIQSVKENLLCGYHLTILRPNKHVDGRFLSFALQHPKISYDFYKYANGITRFGLTSETYNKIKIPLPLLSEQKAIADLLSTWDEAIEKTERLIQAKEESFKRLINDLIHKGQSNHTWKGFSLSDLCIPVSRKNNENNTNVLTSSAHNGLISQLEYYNKSVSAENVTGYYLLKNGEFAYNRSSAKGYPFGATKRLDRYEKGVLSTLYLCFALKPDAPCESDFFLHLFDSGTVNRELRAVCQEGARSHGLLNITKSDFFAIKIFLPSQEQQKEIQSVLNIVRHEIDLLKQLAEKYKTQKRGLMQKILTGIWRIKPEIINQYTEA